MPSLGNVSSVNAPKPASRPQSTAPRPEPVTGGNQTPTTMVGPSDEHVPENWEDED